MEKILCASMMCADFGNLRESVHQLEEAGIDVFHCDIMDGTFVPNFTMGVTDVKAIAAAATKPVDCHLMIDNPANKVEWFIKAGASIIYIHPESERYVVKTLAHIKELGASAGIALNPDTSIPSIEEILHLCDYVMGMTVNPGFSGQKFVQFTRDKIARLAKLKEKDGCKSMVDGACSPQVIDDLSKLGADGFVLGTSALFREGGTYAQPLAALR